jgi:N4-gp56 family major capsid protein
MGVIVAENVAEAVVRLVAADVIEPLRAEFVMGRLVNTNYEPTLQGVGDTVNVPVAPTLAANNIAQTGSVAPQNKPLGNIPVTLTTHAEATFVIPDVVKILTAPNLTQVYAKSAMLAIAEKVESDLLGHYPGFTYNAALGADNADLTEALVDKAETALFNARVPRTEPKFLIVSGDQYAVLRQIARFSEVDKIGTGEAIITGEIGRLKSFYVLRHQLVKKVGNAVYNQAFARDAITLATRRLPLPLPGTGVVAAYAETEGFGVRVLMSYNPNTLAQQFTVDILYGSSVLRATHGQTLISK